VLSGSGRSMVLGRQIEGCGRVVVHSMYDRAHRASLGEGECTLG